MKATRYTGFINCLLALLLLSAVVPCGLLEVGVESFCTTADTPADKTATGEQADDLPLDCCAGCLTCCASSTEPPAPRPLAPAGSAASDVSTLEQGPLEPPLSIWRPPRF